MFDTSHKYLSPHGGNQSGKTFDEAARRISQGKTKVAVLTGAEAFGVMYSVPTTLRRVLLTILQ